ncbi:MAG: pyridoxamine 5'-phosphate oxidase family protein [Hyphomicrobium aestuarii]|nr:pyridoxamine 5'-phosphate oxidase family protein [Hyphomicrobium aestuarii]
MSHLFNTSHRALQDQFDTRRIADRIEAIALKTELGEMEAGFIASRDMMFLSTVNAQGQPTVSYKGGAPGFVRVLDPQTLAFPSYDGNGMFLSMGNVSATGLVGLLFIDFETPNRIRVQGTASVTADDPLLPTFPGAELVVRVAVTEVWPNCPRYIHTYRKDQQSRYTPIAESEPPMAEWKRIDMLQDALPAKDVGKADAVGGTISIETWMRNVGDGKG